MKVEVTVLDSLSSIVLNGGRKATLNNRTPFPGEAGSCSV